ncbi:hypothetical protein [Streptomyces sp. NPDC049879]|uniref:hypothetical protein n=1 Tax=Streptomyces sp. NPDC049879 TaxID=3365598 RepID=UPI003795E69A
MGAGGMTFHGLYNAQLGRLAQAAERWDEQVRRLDDFRGAADDMVAGARSAVWVGENASVTLPMVERHYEQYMAAFRQAVTLRELSQDAHDRLLGLQGELTALVETAASQGVHVSASGLASPGGDPQSLDHEARQAVQGRADDVQAQIDAVLRRAAEADEAVAQALRDAGGADPHAFTGVSYGSLDEAVRAFEDAEWLTDTLGRPPAALTADDRERIADLLRAYGDDPAFAERVATGLGADGALASWAALAGAASAGGVTDAEAGELAGLQAGLGTLLGLATRGDSQAMRDWETDLLALADRRLDPSAPDSPYGFQVASSLMYHGEWDDNFLTGYGDRLRSWEADNGTGHWRTTAPLRLAFGDDSADLGLDPATGLMEALGHNPDAAIRYLGDEGNWTYFVEQRDWPHPHVSGATEGAGYASLGHALESATLGHPYDSTGTPPLRSAERTELFERVVAYYGGEFDPNGTTRVDHHAALTGSLAHIGAAYMPDLQHAVTGTDPPAELYLPGTPDPTEALAFLYSVGRDPDAYGDLVAAQEAYGAASVDLALASPADGLEQRVTNAAESNGQIAGILAATRADAVHQAQIATDEEFNAALEERTQWADRLIGEATAMIPYGGTVAGWAAEDLVAAYGEDARQDTSGTARYDAHDTKTEAWARAERASASTVRIAAGANGFTDQASFLTDTAVISTSRGLDTGEARISELLG